jgi:hypothetical protein
MIYRPWHQAEGLFAALGVPLGPAWCQNASRSGSRSARFTASAAPSAIRPAALRVRIPWRHPGIPPSAHVPPRTAAAALGRSGTFPVADLVGDDDRRYAAKQGEEADGRASCGTPPPPAERAPDVGVRVLPLGASTLFCPRLTYARTCRRASGRSALACGPRRGGAYACLGERDPPGVRAHAREISPPADSLRECAAS